jgi:hypothetical protein
MNFVRSEKAADGQSRDFPEVVLQVCLVSLLYPDPTGAQKRQVWDSMKGVSLVE